MEERIDVPSSNANLMRRARWILAAAATMTLVALVADSGWAAWPGEPGVVVYSDDANRIVSPADGRSVRLPSSGGDLIGVRWSPDGRSVVAVDIRRPEEPVVIGQYRGGRIVEIVDVGRGGEPAFSHDGSRIVFVAADGRGGRGADLYVTRTDGSGRRKLLDTPWRASRPEWSPDGSQIGLTVYRRVEGRLVSRVAVVSADGTGYRELAAGSLASWAPDGRSLAFNGANGLRELLLPGGSPRPLIQPGALDARLEFPHGAVVSPDGRHVVFIATEPGYPGDDLDHVYLAPRDGTAVTALATAGVGGEIGDVQWQPRCTLYGTPGPDQLDGTPGRDVICGLGGDDRIDGRGGDDVLQGGDGDDTLIGGPGEDWLFGGLGSDRVEARDGAADIADGGPGDDTLATDGRDQAR